MSERWVSVALLTSLDPIKEVWEPGYLRGSTRLEVGKGLTIINGTTVHFPRAGNDWHNPVVGFAVYDLDEDNELLLFSGPLTGNMCFAIHALDTPSFPAGSLVMTITPN